ncbi:PREDICTED: C-type lectin domain family 4 member A-like [Acropora digitifera]|uniref:C-type lectin domain family 4 member A-like n=1 Tax=Acropora digitifera TaxID=70779 RepID=UPI000779F4AC|nr:PREDICTED: C-type lectin domain family 4 member A-like [Acropora digitifera]
MDTCPAGFFAHGKSCYYAANKSSASTWSKSRIFCQNLGADLAVIKSEEENKFVYDLLIKTSGKNNGWIGLHRKADKKFYWLDSRPVEGNLTKWGKGKPKENRKEECVHIMKSTSGGKWNYRNCSDPTPVAICQWPI